VATVAKLKRIFEVSVVLSLKVGSWSDYFKKLKVKESAEDLIRKFGIAEWLLDDLLEWDWLPLILQDCSTRVTTHLGSMIYSSNIIVCKCPELLCSGPSCVSLAVMAWPLKAD
jgi:hypothetical protein